MIDSRRLLSLLRSHFSFVFIGLALSTSACEGTNFGNPAKGREEDPCQADVEEIALEGDEVGLFETGGASHMTVHETLNTVNQVHSMTLAWRSGGDQEDTTPLTITISQKSAAILHRPAAPKAEACNTVIIYDAEATFVTGDERFRETFDAKVSVNADGFTVRGEQLIEEVEGSYPEFDPEAVPGSELSFSFSTSRGEPSGSVLIFHPEEPTSDGEFSGGGGEVATIRL